MKKAMLAGLLFCALCTIGQSQSDSLYQLALTDLGAFSKIISQTAKNDREKAQLVVGWFAQNFDWTATDYQKRTVADILQRKGGNCHELAMVAKASMETLGLQMRRVREINIHVHTPKRQADAEKLVAEKGNRMSVFGERHNDHVWIEVFDAQTGTWFPADPSLGVVGERAWLAARFGFGKRFSLNPSSADMIAPFAVFVENTWENRTRHYAVDGFNQLYFGQLAQLPTWKAWMQLVDNLDEKALLAFNGEQNLHLSGKDIEELSGVYEQLKKEFIATDLGQIFQNIDAFSAALVAQRFDDLVAAYTPDAKIFPERMDVLHGSEAIRKYWTPRPGTANRTIHHRIMPEEIKIVGDEAYDWGYYEGKTLTGAGDVIPWKGKYVILWRKTEGGDWKIYLDILNRL